jgi:hypothetical protein
MKQAKLLGLVSLLPLCSCASPVTTPAQAIAVGMRACAEVDKDMPTSGWHAEMQGDHWHVWQGAENRSGPEIDVPRSGRRPDGYKDCRFIVTTD